MSRGPSFDARRRLVLSVLALMMLGLLVRAADLQFNHKDFLQTEGNARYLRVVKITANRGKILDRNGEALAISTPVVSVWAHPGELAGERKRWQELARALELDDEQLHRRIAGRIDREFVYLKRHVAPEVAERVVALGVAGVYLQREYRRYYPTGDVTAHVLGFTDVDDAGQEGVELAFDDWLRGVDGSKRVLRDRLGRIVEDVESISAARDGNDLFLSIDRRIQYLAYSALKSAVRRQNAIAGSAVVLDARTGEVLAMVNQPSFNPNDRSQRLSAGYRNRAVTDVFEPGSTIKPFTILSALEAGHLRADSVVDTRPGFFDVGRHRVRDSRDNGIIDLTTIIKKSSNVGASKIALALPPEQLWRTLTSVGFSVVTGSGFPGESAGILTHSSNWSEIQRATLAFGYGISVTPLQLAQAYTVLANAGERPAISFRRQEAPGKRRRVVSRQVAKQVKQMLEAVTDEDGTGRRARISGYRVAGKTGTIRKPQRGGYSEDRYFSVFAGMAPASSPRLVAVVTIDEPRGDDYYGGVVAAPVFAELMAGALRLLGVAPDDPATHQRLATQWRAAAHQRVGGPDTGQVVVAGRSLRARPSEVFDPPVTP